MDPAKSSTTSNRVAAQVNNPTDTIAANSITRAFMVAWGLACLFYFIEYAVRSSPAVMIPELAASFHTTAIGLSTILGIYYYTYSTMSLVAGVTLDRYGAKYSLPVGILTLAIGCLLFAVSSALAGNLGRLLQGAGSAFAFTGAVYLAAHAFSPLRLATAIGATQCIGMLGGSAGQLGVARLIHGPLPWRGYWIGTAVITFLVALTMYLICPREDKSSASSSRPSGSIIAPFKIVFSNPQSYLCGAIAGLLFAPTTIGDMVWGVAFVQHDLHYNYQHAVGAASMVPLGWVFGCPLLGWISDKLRLRKPVIVGGATVMLLSALQFGYFTWMAPPLLSLLIFGIASGAAMIPYSVMKEVNPSEVKGSATGAINFLTFGVTALLGPVFAHRLGGTANLADPAHFQHSILFWMICCGLAIVLAFFLRETGNRAANYSKAVS